MEVDGDVYFERVMINSQSKKKKKIKVEKVGMQNFHKIRTEIKKKQINQKIFLVISQCFMYKIHRRFFEINNDAR